MPKNDSMRGSQVTQSEVFAACDALHAQGERVTLDAVLALVGRGSKSTIHSHVQSWRSLGPARAVAPDIPVAILGPLNQWFADQQEALARSAREQIEQYRVQAVALQQRLDAETAARTVAEEAANSMRSLVAQKDLDLARLEAEVKNQKGQVEREKLESMGALTRHSAEMSRMRADLDAANAARDAAIAATAAAVKAEGDRVAAQMQSQIDRAMLAQDESRRRAEAAMAETRKVTEALTAAQVELAKAQAEIVRIQQVGQQLVDQATARAQQLETELSRSKQGFVLDGPLVDHLTVRGNRLAEHVAGMLERLEEPNDQVVHFYRLGAALTPLEASAALFAAADETLRRRGSSLEHEVSLSRKDAEGAAG